MSDDHSKQDDATPIPELARLSHVELHAQDRHEIWASLETRMDRLGQQKTRRRSRLFRWGAATVAAAILGLVVAYDQLPLFQATTSATDRHLGQPIPPARDVQAQQSLVQEIFRLASLGKVPNCPFTANQDLIDAVTQAWGYPDRQDAVGKGLYATYETRGFTFGFNSGNQIFDVRTYAPDVQQLELDTVKSVLGEPDHVNAYTDETTDQDIYVYPAGKDYELQLIFSKVTVQNPNPQLDHISVYSLQ